MAHRSAKTVRVWYRVHKWASLLCTALLLMACVTGLPLVFDQELDAILQPHVAPSSNQAGAPTASLDEMVRQTQVKFPSLRPFSLVWDDDEPRIFVIMSPSPDPKDGEIRRAVFDAHTGRLLEIPGEGFNLIEFLLRLHSEMFLGLPGELLMGVMALSFVISLISGALVYGPFMRRLEFGTYRSGGARRTKWFDLHNLLGIVTLTWALVVGATGVMNALSTPLFGLWRAQALPKVLMPYRGKPMPSQFGSVDDSVKKAATALPQMKVSSVLFPNPVFGSPRHYVVWARGKTPVTSRLLTPSLVEVETGKLVMTNGLPWYLRAIEVSRPLHFGDYGGLPLKIIWALFDLTLIVVLVSGLYLWLSRRKTSVERKLDQLIERESLRGVEVL
jgi:uncharacterized iron-regulated membrane protein